MTQIEVDARGLRCPLPVIRLAEAAKKAPAGTVIIVLATDPAARHDIPAWCRMRDHDLRESTEISEATEPDVIQPVGVGAQQPTPPPYLRFVVVLRPHPPKDSGADTKSARWSRET
ncbi:MAG: sulfurtransferase TusA family protein [Dermatophilaceae bacterium]